MIPFKAYNNELKFIDKHITEIPIVYSCGQKYRDTLHD